MSYARRTPAALVALLATLVLLVAGCQSNQDSGIQTPVTSDPTTSAPVAPPSPSASPSESPSAAPTSASPNPNDVAAKAAVAAYKHYMAVSISVAKKKPTPKPSKELLSLTTGLESNYVRNDATARYKEQARIIAGHVPVTAGPVTLSNHAAKAIFQVCLDYRTVKIEEHGKRSEADPWARNRVQMEHVSGRWLVSQQDGWRGKVGDSCPQDIS